MKPDSENSTSGNDERNRSSTEWTPSIIEDSDEGRSSSSTISWTDEADCSIAEQLKLRYEQFEAALYAEAPSDLLTSSERAEKEIWNEFTPHLRITGKKINLVEQERSADDKSSSCGSPIIEEIIFQHPEVRDTGGRSRKHSFNADDRGSGCRCLSSRSKGSSFKEDPTITERMANAVAEKLLEQAWPSVKKVGLLPKGPPRSSQPRKCSASSQPPLNSTESDSSSFKENQSFSVLPIKDMKRLAVPYISFKTPNGQLESPHRLCRAKSSHLDSLGNVDGKALKPVNRNIRNSSARISRKKTEKKEHETESMSENPSPEVSSRNGFLPPIESLMISSKVPGKRANSAMMRLNKAAQTRTRPTTSRSKSLFLAPIESLSANSSSKFLITPIAENSPTVFGSRLPLCSSRKHNKRSNPPRWRY